MKQKKNKKFTDHPFFRQGNNGFERTEGAPAGSQKVLQEYTLLQFFLLKLKAKLRQWSILLKQNVLTLGKETFKSTLFWKSVAFLMVFVWAMRWSKNVKVQFHWPITLSKSFSPQGSSEIQEMNFAGFFSSNEAAPTVNLKRQKAEDYIRRYAKVAIAEHRKFGIPASIKMAQALVESRAGESTLARKNHNHFGIKCFSKKCKTGHCSNLTDDSHKDFFRIYHSAWESWRAHSQLLNSKKYKPLQKYGDDYKAWAKGLKKLGYATDKNYDKKLIEIIETYQLYRLDQQ